MRGLAAAGVERAFEVCKRRKSLCDVGFGVDRHRREAKPRRAVRDRWRTNALREDAVPQQQPASRHCQSRVAKTQRQNLTLLLTNLKTKFRQAASQLPDIAPE